MFIFRQRVGHRQLENGLLEDIEDIVVEEPTKAPIIRIKRASNCLYEIIEPSAVCTVITAAGGFLNAHGVPSGYVMLGAVGALAAYIINKQK